MDFGTLKKHILTNIDDLIILTHPGAIFYESGIPFYLFGHWVQISDNWRSWLHIQNVYIHSYFTLVDCGALWKHIVTNNGDIVNLTPPGAHCSHKYDKQVLTTYQLKTMFGQHIAKKVQILCTSMAQILD